MLFPLYIALSFQWLILVEKRGDLTVRYNLWDLVYRIKVVRPYKYEWARTYRHFFHGSWHYTSKLFRHRLKSLGGLLQLIDYQKTQDGDK